MLRQLCSRIRVSARGGCFLVFQQGKEMQRTATAPAECFELRRLDSQESQLIDYLSHQQCDLRMGSFELRHRFIEPFTQTAVVLRRDAFFTEHFLYVTSNSLNELLML